MVLFIFIFFVMIIAVGTSAVVGFSLFVKRRNRRLQAETVRQFDEPPAYRSLFAPTDEEIKAQELEERKKTEMAAAENSRQSFLARAAENDLTVLRDCTDDKNLYDEILEKLCEGAQSDQQITALAKFVLANKLRTNAQFINKFSAVWNGSFDKTLTLDYLEIAARSEQAAIYSNALAAVTKARRENFVTGFTDEDFAKLAEADFWLLPDSERSSGAGFLVKEKLAELRRK